MEPKIKNVLEFLRDKENRKQFYKNALEHFESQLIWSYCGTTGWQAKVKMKYLRINPQMGTQVLIVGYGIQHIIKLNQWDADSALSLLEYLREKYFHKIEERYYKLIEVGNNPQSIIYTDSDYLTELLNRGFMFRDDVKIKKSRYYLEAEKFNLVHKDLFRDIDDAELAFGRLKLLDYVKIKQKSK